MRIYAFTDVHGSTRALADIKAEVQQRRPDLVVCLGDLTIFEHELRPLLSRVNLLRVPVIMLHGNHESEESMREASSGLERIRFAHKEVVTVDGWHFVAYGGGGFSDEYPELERLAKSAQLSSLRWDRTIVLSHAPPHGTTLDDVGDDGLRRHVGSKTLTRIVKRHKPRLVLAGHIHECFGAEDRIGPTLLVNPGPRGRHFDLDKLD